MSAISLYDQLVINQNMIVINHDIYCDRALTFVPYINVGSMASCMQAAQSIG